MEIEEKRTIEIIHSLSDKFDKGLINIEEIPMNDIFNMIELLLSNKVDKNAINEHKCQFQNILDSKLIDRREINKNAMHFFEASTKIIFQISSLLDCIVDSVNVKEELIHYHMNAKRSYENKIVQIKEQYVFSGRYAIYTVITGGVDNLKEPWFIEAEADYICFTDNKNLKSDIWEIRYLENCNSFSQAKLSRLPKILAHKFLDEYDYSIYVDGKLRIIGDFQRYIKIYSINSPMLCFPHFIRDCIYDEARTCISYKLDNPDKICEQMQVYFTEGLPEHGGLIDAACMVRKHNNPLVIQTMEKWWNEISRWESRRDQLSFNYACWKTGLEYDLSCLYSNYNDYLRKERPGEF